MLRSSHVRQKPLGPGTGNWHGISGDQFAHASHVAVSMHGNSRTQPLGEAPAAVTAAPRDEHGDRWHGVLCDDDKVLLLVCAASGSDIDVEIRAFCSRTEQFW